MLIFETRLATNSDSAVTSIYEYDNVTEINNVEIDKKVHRASLFHNICHVYLTYDKEGKEVDEFYSPDNWSEKSEYLNDVFNFMTNKLKLNYPELYEKYKNDLTIYNTLETIHE